MNKPLLVVPIDVNDLDPSLFHAFSNELIELQEKRYQYTEHDSFPILPGMEFASYTLIMQALLNSLYKLYPHLKTLDVDNLLLPTLTAEINILVSQN